MEKLAFWLHNRIPSPNWVGSFGLNVYFFMSIKTEFEYKF